MASSSDNRFVMGYPSMNKKYSQASPAGYAMPCQPGIYPPPQSPYNGYPDMTESKKYISPSFNVWYNSRNYGPMGWATEEDSSKRFGRAMLVTMVTLIASMCMVSLVIWYLFGAEIPEFRLASLFVSNLNVSDSMIVANWDVNITVFNPNSDLQLNFNPIRASIFYKNFPLAMSAIEPFYLQGTDVRSFQVKLDNEKATCKPLIAEEINKDRSNGNLFFGVRLSLGVKFTSNSIWRKENFRVFCEDIRVNFDSKRGSGILAQDTQTECVLLS